MKLPTFDIQLSLNPADTIIKVNGEDLTNAIQQIEIVQKAGSPPIVTLHLVPGVRNESVRAQCEAILAIQGASDVL